MLASSGDRLSGEGLVDAIKRELLPLVDCLTPNLAEAAALLGERVAASEDDMTRQGRALVALGPRASNELGYFASLRVRLDLAAVRWNGGSGPFATLLGYDVRAHVIKSKRSIPQTSAVVSCESFERRGPRFARPRVRRLHDAYADRLRARSIV